MTRPPVLVDFESQSRCDIDLGGRHYWAHESTIALCCAWRDLESGETGVWLEGDRWPHHGRVLAAHNMMGFDRFGIERVFRQFGALDWIDSSDLARRAGLPGKLEKLGERIGFAKDTKASKFTASLSVAKRPDWIEHKLWTKLTHEEKQACGDMPVLSLDDTVIVVGYNGRDVEVMHRAWPILSPWIDLEPDVDRAHRIINDRGFPFDTELAKRLLECDAIAAEVAVREAADELGWSIERTLKAASSPKQFREATGAANAQKNTLLDMPDSPLARARLASSSFARGKLEAGLKLVHADGTIKDGHLYYGGHTGRFSSVGLQNHNMTRPAKRYEDWTNEQIDELAICVTEGYDCDKDEIDLLLRATIAAPPGKAFAVCDYKGVEARAEAWFTGDQRELDSIAAGVDSYKALASAIFGVPYDAVDKTQRTAGKLGVLACGYQGAKSAIERIAAKERIDLARLGVAPMSIVNGFRKLHPKYVRFWDDAERAFIRAIDGHASELSCFSFRPSSDGKSVAVFLPSGRPLVYNDARMTLQVDKWGREKPTITYYGQLHGKPGVWGDVFAYGGLITENLDQALCRDLLVDALVRAERDGLNPVMHVHDEIVCLVDEKSAAEAYSHLRDLMCVVPSWADGFPIGATGFHGKRYRK